MTALPRFEEVARVRPLDVLASAELELDGPGGGALPQPAPSVAVVAECDGPARLTLGTTGGGAGGEIAAMLDGRRRTALIVGGRLARSRRHGRSRAPVEALALTVTGPQATVLTRSAGVWTARARVALTAPTSDPAWCAGLHVRAEGAVGGVRAGGFGRLGLRDLRLVSNADGTPYSPDGRLLLTVTSAGPGGFSTGHAGVWELDPVELGLTHRSDVFFRRAGRVYGDHAIHLVRDGDDWLVATSTWGGFVDPATDRVHVEIGRTRADLLAGRHVVDTEPLDLPTTGLSSVGVWDPHLVRDPATGMWLIGYVSARRYFDFHPVLATGPSLDALTLRASAGDRHATEGTTLARVGDAWRVLASDGRDNPRAHRAAYPVFDLDLRQLGALAAPYPTNLPWPTLVPSAQGMLLVGFDGAPAGGRLPGYGTHGAVVIARQV